jgi:hypothetical protein
MTPTSLIETRVWRAARLSLASRELMVARFAVFSFSAPVGTADAQVLIDTSRSSIVHLGRLPTIFVVNDTPEAKWTALLELVSAVEPDAENSCAILGRTDV